MSRLSRILRDSIWVILLDIIAINLSCFLALILRLAIGRVVVFQYKGYTPFFSTLYRFMPFYTVLCLIVFLCFKLYGGMWRYAGIYDLNRIIGASIVTTIVHIVGTMLFIHGKGFNHMPITYYALSAALQFFFVTAIRFSYRIFIVEKRRSDKKPGKALVVGAEDLGVQTARVLMSGVFFNVCGIVDAKGTLTGKLINGVPVFGVSEVKGLFTKYSITCVFFADPDIQESQRDELKAICAENNVEFRDYSNFYRLTGETDQITKIDNANKEPEQNTNRRKIPFSPPDIGETEIAEVVDTLNSGWITTGPRTKLLERRLAAYIETGKTDVDTEADTDRWKERVVCLNSATAAEELNLRIFGIGPGDEVIVPAYTYTASASAAIHCGAKIVFVDIQKDGDKDTHCPEMDYEALEAAITEKTKAIIPVDLGGIVCDYDRIFEIVERKKNLFRPKVSDGTPLSELSAAIQRGVGSIAVVSDCAHSLGASRVVSRTGEGVLNTSERRYCGRIAHFSSFSFHAVKNFTTAEGGASSWCLPQSVYDNGVTDAEIYKMYQLLSLHGQNKDALAKSKVGSWEYDIIGPWYKCNMTDIMAAIGLRQLDRYLALLDRRVEMMKKYDAVCDELGISHLKHHVDRMDSSNHLYLIRVPGIDVEARNLIIEKMAERGVSTNVHYKPLPMMTAYGENCSGYPNSYDYYHNLITLPFHTLLKDADVDYVCETLRAVVGEIKGSVKRFQNII